MPGQASAPDDVTAIAAVLLWEHPLLLLVLFWWAKPAGDHCRFP